MKKLDRAAVCARGSVFRMMRNIFTRTGDAGETSAYPNLRISKDHPRIEVCGEIDELSVVLGWARSLNFDPFVTETTLRIQQELIHVMSEIACVQNRNNDIATIRAEHVKQLETDITVLDRNLPPLSEFVIPGSDPFSVRFHHARTVCRRAERRLVTFLRTETNASPFLLAYLNRLSDLLFVMARSVAQKVAFPCLILIGYRATGKTTVAQHFAAKQGWPVVDSDAEVASRTGKTITDIFAQDGEEAFRALESQVLRDLLLSRKTPLVLSTGGGAVLCDKNRALFRQSGHVVWLTASPETILGRIQADSQTKSLRPGLTALPLAEEIVSLLKARHDCYEKVANQIIDTETESPQSIAEKIAIPQWFQQSGTGNF